MIKHVVILLDFIWRSMSDLLEGKKLLWCQNFFFFSLLFNVLALSASSSSGFYIRKECVEWLSQFMCRYDELIYSTWCESIFTCLIHNSSICAHVRLKQHKNFSFLQWLMCVCLQGRLSCIEHFNQIHHLDAFDTFFIFTNQHLAQNIIRTSSAFAFSSFSVFEEILTIKFH